MWHFVNGSRSAWLWEQKHLLLLFGNWSREKRVKSQSSAGHLQKHFCLEHRILCQWLTCFMEGILALSTPARFGSSHWASEKFFACSAHCGIHNNWTLETKRSMHTLCNSVSRVQSHFVHMMHMKQMPVGPIGCGDLPRACAHKAEECACECSATAVWCLNKSVVRQMATFDGQFTSILSEAFNSA
jgi:hypothetical protein